MDSDLHRKHHHYHHHHQPPQPTGLTRYRSAPSSYFSDLINNGLFGDDDNDPFFNSRVSNTETEKSLMKFMSSFTAAAAGSAAGSAAGGGDSGSGSGAGGGGSGAGAGGGGSGSGGGGGSTAQQIVNQIGGFEPQFVDNIKQEPMVYQNQNQFQSQSDYNNQPVSNSTGSSTIEDSMDLPGSLLRQNSSPAGFVDHGYALMRSMDDFRASRGNVPSSMMTSAKRMKNEMGYSSGSQLSSGMLPRIPENESKVMDMKSLRDDGGFGSNSWDDSDILSDSFLKEFGEVDQNKMSSLNSSDNQGNDVGRIRAPTTLVHHLSLPASTAELDKLLQFPDSVPLKSRAKRGCATHPRSIAERVRRTRISERMRKLQDLVPNMDKQTNTADMLDLAVDYIKELQKEAEALSDHYAKCTCAHKQKL